MENGERKKREKEKENNSRGRNIFDAYRKDMERIRKEKEDERKWIIKK